eukprot:366360-Chlamydomonas_euryale.AAC.13
MRLGVGGKERAQKVYAGRTLWLVDVDLKRGVDSRRQMVAEVILHREDDVHSIAAPGYIKHRAVCAASA